MSKKNKQIDSFPDVTRVDYKRMFRLGMWVIDATRMRWRYVRISSGRGIRYYRWLPDVIVVYALAENANVQCPALKVD